MCQIAGFSELSKRVPQPLRGVELTAVRGRRRAPPGTNGSPAMQSYAYMYASLLCNACILQT